MRRVIVLLLFAALPAADARTKSPPVLFPRPLSERIANYSIEVSLDPLRKRLTGHETLVWRNDSPEHITELRFHLYLNAFRDSRSTFMRGRRFRGDGRRGWIDVRSLRTTAGEVLTDRIEFIQPDDDNSEDRTVIRVPLSSPLPPGRSAALVFHFT